MKVYRSKRESVEISVVPDFCMQSYTTNLPALSKKVDGIFVRTVSLQSLPAITQGR